MSLMQVSSPHLHKPVTSVEQVMKQVLLATVPGVLALTWFFGPGTLVNIVFGSILALGFEAWALWLRGKDLKSPLKDHSVIVTATLLCIALPPYAPWWLVAVGIGVSVLLGKHVFGGLGYNPFNPAMVGYVVLLVSFPLQMSSWTEPRRGWRGPWNRRRPNRALFASKLRRCDGRDTTGPVPTKRGHAL
jgi:electron transport complex protein RnfD